MLRQLSSLPLSRCSVLNGFEMDLTVTLSERRTPALDLRCLFGGLFPIHMVCGSFGIFSHKVKILGIV